MFKLLAFGLGVGAAVQAFRQWPATSPASADAVTVVFVVGLVAAYLGGRWRGRGGATAVAVSSSEATAVAQNHVNVAVFAAQPAAQASGGVSMPSDSAPWMVGHTDRRQLELDELDGMELDELVVDHDSSRETA